MLGDNLESAFFSRDRNLVRVLYPALGFVDKREHKIVVEVLAQENVELVHLEIGQRLGRESEVITHREKVRHRLYYRFRQYLTNSFERSFHDFVIAVVDVLSLFPGQVSEKVLRLLHDRKFDLLGDGCDSGFEFLCAIADDISVLGARGALQNLFYVAANTLGRALLDAEQHFLDVLERVVRTLLGAVVGVFEFEVLVFELVEIRAHLLVTERDVGVEFVAHGFVHAFAHLSEHIVKVVSGLFLIALAL